MKRRSGTTRAAAKREDSELLRAWSRDPGIPQGAAEQAEVEKLIDLVGVARTIRDAEQVQGARQKKADSARPTSRPPSPPIPSCCNGPSWSRARAPRSAGRRWPCCRCWDSVMAGRIRLWSGYVLFFYVVTHLLNHALGLISLRVRGAGSGSSSSGTAIGQIALYGSLLVHFCLALWSLYRRRTLRLSRWEWSQWILGADRAAGHHPCRWHAHATNSTARPATNPGLAPRNN
jgi:hypothetical protein